MANIVIIGSGPAGISAALYIRRAGLDVTVIHRGPGALNKAEAIENYYGFAEPVEGLKLWENGVQNAGRLGVKFIEDEVVGFAVEDTLVVLTTHGRYPADGIVIATGSPRKTPPVKALSDFEGRGVSYCAACDGFFYRGRDVGVMGAGEYALHEAMELLPLARSVTLLTDGEEPPAELPEGLLVRKEKVEAVEGDDRLRDVVLSGGEKLLLDGLFIAYGVAGSADLARKVGAETEGNRIVADEHMATSIPGLYAAGDCTGGLMQVAKAVYEGAVAGTELVKYLRKAVR
jgi:thioredoxin reductase (NADPH)